MGSAQEAEEGGDVEGMGRPGAHPLQGGARQHPAPCGPAGTETLIKDSILKVRGAFKKVLNSKKKNDCIKIIHPPYHHLAHLVHNNYIMLLLTTRLPEYGAEEDHHLLAAEKHPQLFSQAQLGQVARMG